MHGMGGDSMRSLLFIPMLLPFLALGDAGYLGSVAQGPVPLDGIGTRVRMLAQDVVIRVDRKTFDITGDFLFLSPSDEGGVCMYFPVDVITPFVGLLYSATEPGRFLERVGVSVNGRAAEVFPLFIAEWDPDPASGSSWWNSDPDKPVTWETVLQLMNPLFTGEPAPGSPMYLTRIPSYAELTGSHDSLDSLYPAFDGQAMNAAWIVEFEAGDTVLVEYTVSGSMTADYDRTMAILCYPLQTGSSWAGSIGRGRVTVVPRHPVKERIAFAAGLMMPPPSGMTSTGFQPLQEIASHRAFALSDLSAMAGRDFPDALVWSFSDFEPRLANTGWMGMYPGLGDMYAAVADSVRRWREGEISIRPSGWTGSFIYVQLADEFPQSITVIEALGISLRTGPSAAADEIAVIPVGVVLEVRERRGDWVLVDTVIPDYMSSGDAGGCTGWVDLGAVNSEGLVVPSAIPTL